MEDVANRRKHIKARLALTSRDPADLARPLAQRVALN
jgi:hypothetical protein